MRKKYLALLILLVSTIAFSTMKFFNRNAPLSLTPYNYANIPFPIDVTNNLFQMDNTPADNPITDDGAALGRVLFYDVDLSINHTVSCASCHQQKFSFSDTARFSRGFNGGLTSRNSMGLIHARFQRDSAFFWDNRAKYLEIQTLIPIQNSVEMGLTLDTMVARLSAKPYYAQLFQAAFGSPTVTSDKVSKALAQFVRSMNTFGSRFRQGVDGTTGNPEIVQFPNFTAQENLGKDLFMDITRGNCQACHTRNVMVQQGAQNIGLDSIYADNGVGAASGRRAQDGKFSVPSLINVALTPPYMHDGRFKTLEQVIDFYSDSIKEHVNLSGFLREIIPGTVNPNNNTCDTCPPRRPHYSPTEKAALVAFLKTLTDTIITTDPRWSNPFLCGTHNVQTITACESYIWNGITYNSSGTFVNSYINNTGCVSADTLKLTITRGSHNSYTIASCSSYNWNGTTYTVSGNYTYNYSNNLGCASVDTLHLTINLPSHIVVNASACNNYVWYGTTYTSSGTYVHLYTNSDGCPSSDTLHLTINTSNNSISATACNSYTWNGTTYNTSGDYLYTYNNSFGCAATDTLHLTINKSTASTTNIIVCTTSLPYSWNGISCSSAGTYVKTLSNAVGCDSIATLVLNTSSVIPAAPVTLTQTLVNNVCGAKIYRYTVTAVTNASGYAWQLPVSVGGISGVFVDSGDINNSRVIRVRYSSNAAAGTTDSIKVKAFSGCGSSIYKGFKLSNTLLTAPAAPASVTITAVSTNNCSNRIYRYTAPTLPVATTTAMAATGYIWSFTGSLGANAVIDSGTVNSRIIRVKFTSNAVAVNGDSVRVLYTSDCGNSANKSYKLTNTLFTYPAAPASISTTLVSDVCGARVYRYTAPTLPIATTTTAAATGYIWTLSTGPIGITGSIDSGTINSRIIRIVYTNNAAATSADSIKVRYTSDCGNSLNKAAILTNLLKSAPASPTVLTQTLVSDVCGARVYRYTVTAVTNATGYAWTLPLSVGGVLGVAVDSGDINIDRIIKIRYTSNAAAISTDSIKVRAFSGCGSSATKGFKLTNLAKSGCPTPLLKELPITYTSPEKRKNKKSFFSFVSALNLKEQHSTQAHSKR
jgi:cytochrome c peroxidase